MGILERDTTRAAMSGYESSVSPRDDTSEPPDETIHDIQQGYGASAVEIDQYPEIITAIDERTAHLISQAVHSGAEGCDVKTQRLFASIQISTELKQLQRDEESR